jgi:hypothetical protein
VTVQQRRERVRVSDDLNFGVKHGGKRAFFRACRVCARRVARGKRPRGCCTAHRMIDLMTPTPTRPVIHRSKGGGLKEAISSRLAPSEVQALDSWAAEACCTRSEMVARLVRAEQARRRSEGE